MENLIFGAFATLDGYREGDAANLGRTVYDRCTVVALCSAKAQNPACTVALLTNAPVPEPFRSQLTQGGVEIWDCPFTTYRVPADTNWALAYYKLCAMAWVLENRDFARAARINKISSGLLWASLPSESPPSQLIPASSTRMAAPFKPAHAKNSRLNAASTALRSHLGHSQ